MSKRGDHAIDDAEHGGPAHRSRDQRATERQRRHRARRALERDGWRFVDSVPLDADTLAQLVAAGFVSAEHAEHDRRLAAALGVLLLAIATPPVTLAVQRALAELEVL